MPFIKLSVSEAEYDRIQKAAGEVPLAKWVKLRLREALDAKGLIPAELVNRGAEKDSGRAKRKR